MFNITDELHEHCNNSDVWTSFILVLTRDCARIFGLSYGKYYIFLPSFDDEGNDDVLIDILR